jgi:hypothetical protein
MHLKRYDYFASNDFQSYSFYSDGPKGRIKKTVVYSKIQQEPVIYNLAFGDEDFTTGKINDNIVSDNDDRDIILATVAGTVYSFCERYGNEFIHVKGSSPSRTRLYQMGISGLLDEISIDFDVYGYKNRGWYTFQKNVNYEAFLVKRK